MKLDTLSVVGAGRIFWIELGDETGSVSLALAE